MSYPDELASTHINAIAALSATTLLATLFHNNCVLWIDRASGDGRVLLDIQRGHAVRVLAPDLISVADTCNGQGLLLRVRDGNAEIVSRVSANTTWLHDAFFDGKSWMLVDGANSRVVHTDAAGTILRVDTFDPEWCLYEVLPWVGPLPRDAA
jgi:hypothetical protein